MNHPRRHGHAFQHAFTLIELLVVIVIIGIIVTMASLSLGVLGRDNEVEEQARRLQAVIEQVREESELQGRDTGLLIERDGYLFMRYQYATRQWQVITGDDLTSYREFPEGVQARLRLEGREVVLKSHAENQAMLARETRAGSSASSSSTSNTINSVRDGVVPQIAILSSSDVSPFELRLSRDDSEFSWRVTGKADNTLEIDSGNNLQ